LLSGLLELKVSNKIRHFMWHAAKQSLPTKQNLFKRNVLDETQCSHYEEHLIDCLHTLWLCDQAQ